MSRSILIEPILFQFIMHCCFFQLLQFNAMAEPTAQTPEDYDLIPTPTPITTIVYTAPTTTTTSLRCEYSYLDARWYDDNTRVTVDFSQTGADADAPACIVNRINIAWNECQSLLTWHPHAHAEWDKCVAWKIFGASQSMDIYYNPYGVAFAGNSTLYGAQYDWAPATQRNVVVMPDYCYVQAPWGIVACWIASIDLSDRLYIKQNSDGSCSGVSSPPSSAVSCYAGTYNWYSSPISLLWDDTVDIENDLQLVSFPLDLDKDYAKWSVWKASAKAPLLVYDPEHQGKITSPTQLFGDWTFGGQKQAKLDDIRSSDDLSGDRPSRPTKWNNGYEALATLDKNGDGEISNHELTPLALWFDENRNGISEPGEVKQLELLGVTKLFYQPNRLNKSTNSLYADRGFQRHVDGKAVLGRSVDWRSDTASSKAELINRHLAPALACSKSKSQTKESLSSEALAELRSRAINSSSMILDTTAQSSQSNSTKLDDLNISGIWRWRSTDSKAGTEGYFGFSDYNNGKIQGHVYSIFGVSNRTVDFSNIFSAAHFDGKKITRHNNKIIISFTVKPDDTSIIENRAVYDPFKQTISGYSLAKVSYGTTALDLKYSWVASRLLENNY